MKKFFSLILVAMLSLSPIYTLAAEDTQALTPTTSEAPAEIVPESPAPEVSAETPAPAVTEETTTPEVTPEAPAEGSKTDGTTTEGEPSEEKPNTDGSTEVKEEETKPSTEESSDGTEEGAKKKTEKTSEDIDNPEEIEKTDEELEDETLEEVELAEEKTEEELEKERLEKELKEKEDRLKLKAQKRAELPEHIHEFQYTSNGDGTHTINCIAKVVQEKPLEEGVEDDEAEFETEEVDCEYEEIEECEYDLDGNCIYCGYIKPKEDFNPSISISISNASCVIGQSNPIISLAISQKGYDIDYAQICFANYSRNKFINVSLAHNHYYNPANGEFVYESDDRFYACPEIDDYYFPGTYSVRSLYVRSTTGESVHYSLESGNLPDGYHDCTIDISRPTTLSLIRDLIQSNSNSVEPTIEEPIVDESILAEDPYIEDSVVEELLEEESDTEEPMIEPPVANESQSINETPVNKEPELTREAPKAEEPKGEAQKSEEPKSEAPKDRTTNTKAETQDSKETRAETPKDEDATYNSSKDKSSVDTNTTTQNNDSENQKKSNSFLKFLKKLFNIS